MQHVVMGALDLGDGIDLYVARLGDGVARARQTGTIGSGAQEALCIEGKAPQAGDILWTTYFYHGRVIRPPP